MTMKKHFLLLMMAFFSLAGWAQIDITNATAGAAARTYGSGADLTIEVRLDGAVAAENYTVDTKFYTSEALNEVVKVGAADATKETLPVGTHYIKITGNEAKGYTGTKAIELKVNKAPLHLTIATQHTVYGTPFTVTAPIDYALRYDNPAAPEYELKNGETLAQAVAGTITAVNYTGTDATKSATGTALDPAKDPYDVTFEGLTSANYELTCTGAMDIWKKSIVNGTKLATGIAISATGNTATYNKAAQAPTFTVSLNGTALTAEEFAANFTAETAGDATNAGSAVFTIKSKATGNFEGDYTGSEDNKDAATYKLTINPAVAIVKAKKQTREYNGVTTEAATALGLAAAQFDWTGLFAGDAIEAVPVANLNEDAKNAGEYSIVLTAPAAGWGNANYTVGLDNTGVYEITKKALTITADDKNVVFGAAAPTLTATIVGYTGKDADAQAAELAELKKGVSAKFVDGFDYSTAEAGTYPNKIEPVVDATKAAATFANYTWEGAGQLVKGKLTIGAAQILIAIKAAKKTYGAADPEDLANSVTVTGATAGLTKTPTVKRVAGEDVGTYLMTIDTEAEAQEGYEILYTSTPVYFTIEKAPLTITALTQILPIQANVAAATAALDQAAVTITGLVNGDTKDKIGYSLAVADGTEVGTVDTYANKIEVTAADDVDGKQNKNYTITKVNGNLVISSGATLATIDLPADETLMDILNYNDGANVNAKVEFKRDQALASATWAAEKWNTLVLPFDIRIADLSKALGYAIVNVVNPEKTTEKNVVFKLKMSGTITANTPFLVKTEDAIANNATITFNNVTIKKPASEYPSIAADDGTLGYKFVGAYKTKAIDNSLSYIRFLLGNDNQWKYIKSSSTNTWNIVPFAAYIDLGEANVSNAREITFTMEDVDGTKTSIRSIDTESIESNYGVANGWYTIGGMKLQGAPTQKGIYINNGKKVIIK